MSYSAPNNIYQWFSILVVLFSFNTSVHAAVPDNIDYQGYLTDTGGSPVNTTVNISFSLYNVDTGGIALWSDTQSVVVTNGLFNVKLGSAGNPFPVGLFDAPLYIGIDVAGDGEMSPRASLSSAGFAHKAGDADSVGGVSAGSLVTTGDLLAHSSDMSNPHNVTASQMGAALSSDLSSHSGDAAAHHSKTTSFTDLTDQVAAAQLPDSVIHSWEVLPQLLIMDGPGSGLDADALDGYDSSAFAFSGHTHTEQGYGGVAIVAQVGGQFTNPLDAMADLPLWCGLPSATNPCMIRIMPGIYDIGNNGLAMVPYVDIEGSGENTTTITSNHSATTFGPESATLTGADNAELRFIKIVNRGGSTYAYGIHSEGTSPKITNVTVETSGASASYAIVNRLSSQTVMNNVTISAVSSGSTAYGVLNVASATTMINMDIDASGGSGNYGVNNTSTSKPIMNNLRITANGGNNSYGVYNTGSSSPTMTNVKATATGGTTNNYGVRNGGASPKMNNVIATASGGINSYGVNNSFGASPQMTDVVASGTGATTDNYGVYNQPPVGPIMKNVTSNNVVINGNELYVMPSGSLLLTVNDVIAGLGTPSATKPYVVKLGAGTFDIGTSSLQMQDYVDLEGSGSGITKITSNYDGGSPLGGTIRAADNSEIRFVEIENRGGGAYATAFSNNSTSPRLTNVTISAFGATENYAFYATNFGTPIFRSVRFTATGGDKSYGIFNQFGAVDIQNSSITISGANLNVGIHNEFNSILSTIDNVNIEISSCYNGNGIEFNNLLQNALHNIKIKITDCTWAATGIYNIDSTLGVSNADVSVSALTSFSYGVFNSNGTTELRDITITSVGADFSRGIRSLGDISIVNAKINASGGVTISTGVSISGESAGTILNSNISGDTYSIENLTALDTYKIAGTMLGGTVNGVGYTCINSYNNALSALNASCQ